MPNSSAPAVSVTARTRLFAILADPVAHVKAPMVMHRVFAHHGVDGVLVPMHVASDGLARAVEGLRQTQNFGGFIVTMPHKEAMLHLCDEVTEEAQHVGAVNCVRRERDGRMIGTMLDGAGFLEGLRRAGHDPQGMRVFLAGAGGAASAIAFALADAGATGITVANRTEARARALLDRLARRYPALVLGTDAGTVADHDLVVNATSQGMRPGDSLPLDVTRLHGRQIVAEAIMDPEETPLLAKARATGCTVHLGLPMLTAQIELMARHMGAIGGSAS
ncbi:shikimate dehydrogenase family protein [Falsirhodobacter sp. 20TX0035]|uniref:shikimate dehydrogenase family protein n=1 Tax=Falsirhodobacter sp. 20TX0035 TaxID=3022019 RepID=UPI00232DAC98|nr:shikimate dehydrogenase [Falsirhodobacter sp. 20TX0035]MDB6454162.1 shikimate dehydrogenase [Falsirhodobacter sp. 20TX0035]